ncbi:N-formylglutamate deformylase [compost metagenome]
MLVDLVETIFTSAGLKVARNRPYAGGFVTRTYGRPQHGVHAIQIEISRHLYMNEVTLNRHDGFEAMRAIVERLTFALIGLDLVALAGSQPMTEKAAAE